MHSYTIYIFLRYIAFLLMLREDISNFEVYRFILLYFTLSYYILIETNFYILRIFGNTYF